MKERLRIDCGSATLLDCDLTELRQPWETSLERLLHPACLRTIPFDKFREECGVFAIHGHSEASNLAYLGLYALQHRGQESAGIATSDHREIRCSKSMGHVADIFTPERIASLPGNMAIGHTRYSTAGDTVLLNAQPFWWLATRDRSRWRTTATSPTPRN